MRRSCTLQPRRHALFCFVIVVATLCSVAHAIAAPQLRTILAPERFTRGAGAPQAIVRTFTVAPPVVGPFTLTIDSGEPDPRRAGALINVGKGTAVLNGAEVVGPRDFAKQFHIERSVTLQSDNVLEITLIGAPGSILTLGITGVVHVNVSSIQPDNGPVGTQVLIMGDGFDPIASNNQVYFNGAPAQVLNAATTAIQTVVPANATTGPITVTTPNGSASSAPFTVTAANQLLISRSPDQPTYSRGQPITITALLVDGNGQPVTNAVVTLESAPAADSRTGNTFIYDSDGVFTITATAEAVGQPPLTASVTLTVQGAGATITCAPQFNGTMINGVPGAALAFTGSVSSVNGISAFTVNGTNVVVNADGTFSTSINPVWGLNAVELALVDNSGLQTRQLCSFLLSANWVAEDAFNDSSVMLSTGPTAIDDLSRAGAINSFGDILAAVINSAGPGDTVHQALSAANPLKPLSCDQTDLFGICVQDSEVLYSDSQLPGPNTSSLTLVDGGMHSSVRFQGPRVTLRVSGHSAFIPYDITGDVIYDFVQVDTTFDTAISGGRPHVSVRPGSVAVNVGGISTNFVGLDSSILTNVIVPLAQSYLRNILADSLRDYVVNNFESVLDGVSSGFVVLGLPATFEVPQLNAGAPLTMAFGYTLSSLDTNVSRALFGLGTRFTSATAHARPSLGTALQFPAFIDPHDTYVRPLTEAFHESIRGQALHALWRAGYFDTILTGGALNGAVPAGATVTTTATLPPVIRIRSDARTEIGLGGMNISLEQPAVFANPLQGSLAGRVSCNSQLAGDAIVFDACTVDEFHFVAARPLDNGTAANVEALLANVMGAMLTTAAGNALPVLPVPAFTLPSSLGTFGLPTTGSLRLVFPVLLSQVPHYLVSGTLGIR